MITELDLEEGKEFSPNLASGADLQKQGFAPGRNRKDYALTLDAAWEDYGKAKYQTLLAEVVN